MGMYTRLTFWAEIDNEAAEVINTVLAGGNLPEKYKYMVRPIQSSSYSHVTQGTVCRWDDVAEAWFLNVDTSCKNYGQEIQQFLTWIHPHAANDRYEEDFAGFYQYESGLPVFIWHRKYGFEFTKPGESA